MGMHNERVIQELLKMILSHTTYHLRVDVHPQIVNINVHKFLTQISIICEYIFK
jgi:hypothetical protein